MKEQLKAGKSPDEVSVNVRLDVIKEVGACWLVSLYDYLSSHPDIRKNGFVQAGISGAISNPDSISQLQVTDENDPFDGLTDSDCD